MRTLSGTPRIVSLLKQDIAQNPEITHPKADDASDMHPLVPGKVYIPNWGYERLDNGRTGEEAARATQEQEDELAEGTTSAGSENPNGTSDEVGLFLGVLDAMD